MAIRAAVAATLLAANGCGSSSRCTSGASCIPANPCHLGTQACQGGSASCTDIDQLQPNGSSCGDGGSCVAGSCVGGEGTGCLVALQNCGPSAANVCVSTDPNNCGECGTVCLTGQCQEGGCFGCRQGFPQDCPEDQYCKNGFCGPRCAFGLVSGAEQPCGTSGLCRPFESIDPPLVDVGICTPAGQPSDPGLGEPCAGPCRDGLDCVPGEFLSSGGAACANICDPFLPGNCPSGWGCAAVADALGFYVGYGHCHPFATGQLDVGEACGGMASCQPGTTCIAGGLADGGLGCAIWCDPLRDGGCGPDGCAAFTTSDDDYIGIGACAAIPFGTQGPGDSCQFQFCELPLSCSQLTDGQAACLQVCDPWHPYCAGGDSCLPLFGIQNNDYQGNGVCYPVPANAQPEFGECNPDVNNCDADLYCSAGNPSECVLFCDPFNPATCPAGQWCAALSDPQGTFAGAGLCTDLAGSKHSGETCTFGDCLSGDCYYRTPQDPGGICIQACPLGTLTSCLGGECADGGLGNGLGYCVLADGGPWD